MLVNLHELDLQLRGQGHEHGVPAHAGLDAVAVQRRSNVLEKAHVGGSFHVAPSGVVRQLAHNAPKPSHETARMRVNSGVAPRRVRGPE